MDTDNLNIETRLPDLLALYLAARRTAMDWPLEAVLPVLPNAYAEELATPSVIINCPGYTTTGIVGEMELEVVINLRNTTNDLGFTLAQESLYVSRLRRELGRGPLDTVSFQRWLADQTEEYRQFMRVKHVRHAGGSVALTEEEHLRTRQTRVKVCVWADEIAEAVA